MMKSIILASALAAVSMGVQAGEFYVLGDVGQSKIEFTLEDDYSVSKSDTMFDLGAGYTLNENFAFEFAYRDLGGIEESDEDSSFSSDLTSLQLSALGKLPVNDALYFYGRLGFARLEVETNDKSYDYPQTYTYESSSETKTKALFGLGLGYNLTQDISLRGEYIRHAKWEGAAISSLSLGATYSF